MSSDYKQCADHMNTGIGLVSKPDKGLSDPKAPSPSLISSGSASRGKQGNE